MDTNWLTDFLVLGRTGSFSQAAEERCITQSAFSRRIKALETWLGADLFDRSSYPVALTEEGRNFHETAESILRELNLNRAEFQLRRNSAMPDLRLAAASTLAISFVPQWLQQLKTNVGDFIVSLDTYDFFDMIELLADRKMDLVLLFYHPEVPSFLEPHQFEAIKLGVDIMHLCTPTDAEGKPLYDPARPPKGGLDYIGYAQSGYFSKIENLIFSRMSAQDPKFNRTGESGTCEFIKKMAFAEQKMMWLPTCSAHDVVSSGSMALAGDGKYDTELEIWVYKNRDEVSPLVQKIWTSLQNDPCVDHLERLKLV